MINKKQHKLAFGTKLSLIILLLVLLISLPILFFVYNYIDIKIKDKTQNILVDNSKQIAEKINSQLNEILYQINPIAESLENLISTNDINKVKDKINNTLDQNKHISGIWIMLNPEEFVSNENISDFLYASVLGNITKVFVNNSNNKHIFKPLNNIKENQFLDIFKELKYSRRNTISAPSIISDYGTLYSTIQLSIPVTVSGRFIGVVGIHLSSQFIGNILKYSFLNDDAISAIFSNSGDVIFINNDHYNKEANINNFNIYKSETMLEIEKAIKSTYSYSINQHSAMTNSKAFTTVIPIHLKKYNTNWALVNVYPDKSFFTDLNNFTNFYILIVILGLLLMIALIHAYLKFQLKPLRNYLKFSNNISNGFYLQEINEKYLSKSDEIGNLFQSLKTIQESLRNKDTVAMKKYEEQNKYITGTKLLLEQMRGNQDIQVLAKNVLSFLAKFIDAQVGTFYLYNDETKVLELSASFSFTKRKGDHYKINLGEGVLGQAAIEKQIVFLTEIPPDYISISSALGDAVPQNIIIAPFVYEDKLIGVIELATYLQFDDAQIEFIKNGLENIAIAFNSAGVNKKVNLLYQEAQNQAEKLQTQQEELIATNEELEAQTVALRNSEHKLIEQQEELQAINEELEEKTSFLEKQKGEIIQKNEELLVAQYEIAQKAKEIELTSQYKSEFLANMSHELRTPLNSILILATNLFENSAGNLVDDQVESSKIIYQCGIDLLNLINDILDLSKIEAGKMTMNFQATEIIHIADSINKNFKKLVENKGLKLIVDIAADLPKEINTDSQRLEQVIKNFVSNAVKFTSKGEISVLIRHPDESVKLRIPVNNHKQALEICIKDTGIGIPKNKQREIFEAFHQLESHLSRNYNGTGLGLSIAKEITHLLNGVINLKSIEGEGSEFSIIIPINTPIAESDTNNLGINESSRIILEANNELSTESVLHNLSDMHVEDYKQEISELFTAEINMANIEDDRNSLKEGDKLILVVEDDLIFAKILYEQVTHKSFKCIYTATGEEALALADKFKPDAIILDIKLPGINGWEVLQFLKENPNTRHIPVHMMSGEGNTIDAKRNGAVGFISKPTTKDKLDKALTNLENLMKKKIKDLLVVEDDSKLRKSIIGLLKADDVTTYEADSGAQALQFLKYYNIDCMVLDLTLPDMTGFDLLNIIQRESDINIPPIIVYTGKDLSKEEETKILKFAESIIIKGVKSEERLIDETALFLHRVVDKIQVHSKDIILNLHDKDSVFKDKNVLLVDDDIRNAFAVSKVLKEKGINITVAENGEKAIEALKSDTSFNMVLMDIMMPIMDGYTAITKIRTELNMKKLPIIALTAKAMKEDRDKCINAGANDYLSKPIDLNKLYSLLRVWLYK